VAAFADRSIQINALRIQVQVLQDLLDQHRPVEVALLRGIFPATG
jgi:hypothetical protein